MISKLFFLCLVATVGSVQSLAGAQKESTALGNWGLWSSYFPCNATCGGGYQRRMRFCSNHQHTNDLKCLKTDGVAGRIETVARSCNSSPCKGGIPSYCVNWDSQCDKYAGEGHCSTRKAFMDEWCCKSCYKLKRTPPVKAPVNGNWGAWTGYTKCDANCGGGTKIRTRICDKPVASSGGLVCLKTGGTERALTERDIQRCNLQPCATPVHGSWGKWTAYGDCNESCGGGQQIRTRTCDNPIPKDGGLLCTTGKSIRALSETQSQQCNTQACSNKPTVTRTYPKQLVEVDGKQASAFCSASGTTDFKLTWQKYRPDNTLSPHVKFFEKSNFTGKYYYKQNIMIFEKLSSQDTGLFACVAENKAGKTSGVIQVIIQVNGNWGEWERYTACDKTCGGGEQTRSRYCNSPRASNGGLSCLLSDNTGKRGEKESATQRCNNMHCDLNGSWGEWQSYSACDKSCGGGQQTRSRYCDSPVTYNGGLLCLLSDKSGNRRYNESATQRCNIQPCNVVPPKTCKDKRSNCLQYAEASYCTKRADYMSEYCCKTCERVKGRPAPPQVVTEPPVEPPKACEDRHTECVRFAEAGYCATQSGVMAQHCCKTCKSWRPALPRTEAPVTQPPVTQPPQTQPPVTQPPQKPTSGLPVEPAKACEDRHTACVHYAEAGYCIKQADVMSQHCCKTCKSWRPAPPQTQQPRTQAPVTQETKKPATAFPVVRPQRCDDKRSGCLRYAEAGYCAKREDYMSVYCCKTCKEFKGRPQTTEPQPQARPHTTEPQTQAPVTESPGQPCTRVSHETKVTRDTLVKTISSIGTEYTISFEMMVSSFGSHTYNLIHLTTGTNKGKYGSRLFAIWFDENQFQIYSSLNGRDRVVYKAGDVEAKKWISVKVKQANVKSRYIYSIVVNGLEVKKVWNKQPAEFKLVKVFTSDPWYPAQDAYIRKLEICSGVKPPPTTVPEPVNGNWGEWRDHGACNKQCGGGERQRLRYCDSPRPANGGLHCLLSDNTGSRGEVEKQIHGCNMEACIEVVDGAWGEWAGYSECDKECGGGEQSRLRYCNSPRASNGGLPCLLSDNSGRRGLIEKETRRCNNQLCEVPPVRKVAVNGNWGEWSKYGECDRPCNGGQQHRLRYCNSPRASNGGVLCLLSDNSGRRYHTQRQTRNCNIKECAPPPVSEVRAECSANVGFVLDSSGTLKRDFYSAKRFMKRLAESFGVSRTGSRASVITFSYNALHNIKFNDYYDITSFNRAVDRLPLIDSTTRIDLALRLAQREMFEERNGAKNNMNKVLILLSDGAQTKRRGAEDPAFIAEELRRAGINILVVAIGGVINPRNLVRIAGHPSRVFYAKTLNELIKMNPIEEITQSTCYYTDPTVDCSGIMDVGFLLDSSGSDVNNFNAEKKFVKTLAATYGLSRDGSRTGVVTFSSDIRHSIKLNDYFRISGFNKAVDNLSLRGPTTMIDKALRFAEREVFDRGNGARAGVPDLLVLITDGSQTSYVGAENPAHISRELRARGTEVIVVGIGNAIDAHSLAAIAGGSNSRLFTVANFEELVGTRFIQRILRTTCKEEPIRRGSIRRVCEDDYDACSLWSDKCRGYSLDWSAYMKRSCRKTCRYC